MLSSPRMIRIGPSGAFSFESIVLSVVLSAILLSFWTSSPTFDPEEDSPASGSGELSWK
jgi:hypothetical protein